MINFHNSVDIFSSYFIIIFITFIYNAIQVRAKARVRVEGMTCNRCVNFIQTKMKEVEGVVDIMVSFNFFFLSGIIFNFAKPVFSILVVDRVLDCIL